MSRLKLYNAQGSSAAYRVRIALALKQLEVELIDVNLTDGSQHDDAYVALNPQRLIPALVDGDTVLTQSLPILEYLDERYPQRPILPRDSVERARQRALAHIVVSDIHPIQNLRNLGRHAGRVAPIAPGRPVSKDSLDIPRQPFERFGPGPRQHMSMASRRHRAKLLKPGGHIAGVVRSLPLNEVEQHNKPGRAQAGDPHLLNGRAVLANPIPGRIHHM